MKRFIRLSILLTVVLSMSGLNASAYDIAVKDANSVTIYYNYYNEGKELEVTNDDISQMPYTGNVVIPEEVIYDNQMLKVISIGDRAFYNCFGLTSITIPKSMRAIGEDAFKGCGNISSVHISDLAAWCNIAFFNNSSNPMCWDLYNDKHLYLNGSEVKDLVIPSGVTSIGQWAFANCKSITSVTIPNSVTYIGTAAFNSCPNIAAVYISDLASWCGITFVTGDSNPLLSAHRLFLNGNEVKDLVIPSTVTSIGADAFQDCTGLTSVTIPNSVTTIGGYAFYGCTGINSLNIPNSVTTIGDYAFYGCTEINSLNIPNSLTTIENGTFRNCSNITSVSIPASLTSVGDDAFKGCSRLTSVHISDIAAWCNISFSNESANPLLFAHHLFLDGSEVKDLVIPSHVTAISNYAFNGCTELTSIDIGNRVKTIGWCAFQDCQRLTSLNIGNNVTSIGNAAFNGCTSLTKLTIPNSVTSIDSWAFANCTSLENFIIPNSVKNIEGGAFKGCSSLTSVIIPNSVTYLGVITFQNCKRLTSVIIGNGVTSIENSMFAGCSSLSSVTLGNNVTSIESNAFRDCTSLPSMNIPEGVTSIGEAAFYDCKGLTSVTIPNSLTSIGWGAFYGCSSLESVTIPNSVTELGAYAFYDCNHLSSAIIGDGVTSIGECTFYACRELTSVTIPNSVTELGAYAFQGCNHLTSAIIGDGVTSIGGFAFYECGRLSTVIIGNSIKEISRGAFSNCTSLKDFYCYSKDVPTANGVFTPKVIQNVTLYVPITAVNAYQVVEPWKNFKEIIGMAVQDDYRPLVEEGKHWTYDNFMPLRPAEYDHYYYYDLRGDTLIAGKNCLKMFSDNSNNDGIVRYEGALYEENKKVYCFYPEKEEAVLLYDFDCEVGDTIHVDEGEIVVKDIRTEDNGGIPIKKYTFQIISDYEEEYVYWIEGVGAMMDFFSMMPAVGNYCSLNACELNGEKLYQTVEPEYTEEGYHKMAIEGKRWNYIYYYMEEYGFREIPYSYVVKGDTIIGRTTYKKLWYQDEKTERLVCLLLERGREVFKSVDFGDNSNDSPVMKSFFDFGREDFGKVYTWESVEDWGNNTNWMVYGVDTIEVNNRPFRRYTCLQKYSKEGETLTTIEYDGKGVWHDIWVEGVGSASNGIEDQFPPHEPPVKTTSDYTYFVSCYENGECIFTADDFNIQPTPKPDINMAYRPFVEEGKVWKVGSTLVTDNLVKLVGYYYFDGDTIIDGKTCKQMMWQRYVSPDYPDYAIVMQYPLLQYVGAWYEEDKKVYVYNTTDKQFKLMYDFSVDDNAPLQIHGQSYVIGPKQSGGMKGFKGVYRDVVMTWEGEQSIYNTTWLEGVGSIEGPTFNVYYGEEYHGAFLMSCSVGDEVIYLNDEYEDGATPEDLNAKKRFDFTHTIKVDPKAPKRRGAGQPLYGEYNNCSVVVNLYPLDEAYQVRITDGTDKVVYEKNVNAGNIVGLNIDISAYPEGCYTVTMENNHESFIGVFEIQTTGIAEVRSKQEAVRGSIYNLQGQRLNSLQKGLNIVNGRKVYVGADRRIHP